jgi:HEPN domain-containing protein
LDKYYIPTIYTDSWADGTPEDYYTKEDAFEAIELSKSIIDEIEKKWISLKDE